MDIVRMRGGWHHEAMQRAGAVVAGQNITERNSYVLGLAANIVLADSLKSKKRAEKHDILSDRQIRRRHMREVYLPGGFPTYLPHHPGHRRGSRGRRATEVTIHDMTYDA